MGLELNPGEEFQVTFDYVEQVLKGLPISYYAGRDVEVKLSKGKGSFYIPMEDRIEIDYNAIAGVIASTGCIKDIETYVRTLLYHEISHAILTPENISYYVDTISCDMKLARDVFNIFEDERIETLMEDFFYGVDFKRYTVEANHWKGSEKEEPPNDVLSAFYRIVRFRSDYKPGRTEFVNRVQKIIDTYPNLSRDHNNYASRYVEDIKDLFWDIAKDYCEVYRKPELEEKAGGPKAPPRDKSGSKSGESGSSSGSKPGDKSDDGSGSKSGDKSGDKPNGSDSSSGGKSGDKSDDGSGNKPDDGSVGEHYDKSSEPRKRECVKKTIEEEARKSEEGSGGDGSGNGSETRMGDNKMRISPNSEAGNKAKSMKESPKIKGPHPPQTHGDEGSGDENLSDEEVELSEEEMQQLLDKIKETLNKPESHKENVQKILDTEKNKFYDPALTERIGDIIENFLARTKNNSSAMMRYSGRMNVRRIGREDWRVWDYKSKQGAIKGFDKLHLNLFIDTSGSFCDNEDRTNTILRSLTDLEKKYPFFSFDLVTCQISEKLRTKRQRYIQTGGGNRLDDKIWDIFNKLQDPTSFNYNIALFDGDAFSDCCGSSYYKNFGAFNTSKCSIISDYDNKEYIEKYAPQAHSIFVKNRYYGGSGKSYAEMLYDNILEAFHKALL